MLDTSRLPHSVHVDMAHVPITAQTFSPRVIAAYAALFAAAMVAEFDAQEHAQNGRPIRDTETMVAVTVQTGDNRAVLRVPSNVTDAETALLEARVHAQEAIVYAAIGEFDDAVVSAAAAQWHCTGTVRMTAPGSQTFAAMHEAAAVQCRAELAKAQTLTAYDLTQVADVADARHAKFAALCLRLMKVCEMSEAVVVHAEREGFHAELVMQSRNLATLARDQRSLFARLEGIKTSFNTSVLKIVQ